MHTKRRESVTQSQSTKPTISAASRNTAVAKKPLATVHASMNTDGVAMAKEVFYYLNGCPFPDECNSEKTTSKPKKLKFWGWTVEDCKHSVCEHLKSSQLHDTINSMDDARAKLNQLGYNAGPVDGISGRKTTDAISNFQRNNGLQVTGELDEATIRALGI